jgi:hypothetical protein
LVSVKNFAAPSTNKILAQPVSDKPYFRSSNAADTANHSLTGLVAGVSTTETDALNGKVEVRATNIFTSLTALLLSAVEAGTVSVYASGVAAYGYLIVSSQPANNDTLLLGLTGFVQTYIFKTTLTGAANEILIGASASATASNLSAAINAGAGSGTVYGTGTVANAYVSATVTGQILTITDRIPCRRQLAWSITQGVGATLSLSVPIGGVDGTVLATFAPGLTQAFNAFTLQSENLVALTLPAKVFLTTGSLQIGGKQCTLRFKCATVGTPIPVSYQTSSDNINWSTGLTAITSLNAMTVLAPQFVHPSEINIEWIRLVFASNANTTDTALDAAVIF